MSKIKNAVLLDKLLDKWDAANITTPPGTYFQSIVGLPGTGTGTAPTNLTLTPAVNTVNNLVKLQEVIKKLYLVFHYPTYESTGETKFDSKNNKPEIIDTKGVFNYVLPDTTNTNGGGKRLLSSAGIGKKDMINLKMIIDKIVTANTESDVIKLLYTDESDEIATVTMGGNNTTDILPKNAGGKNNKSNKRIKKQPRRRNKSSKSLK